MQRVGEGLKFNPRVWHATEDALAPEERVLAVGYTLAAGKKASVEDKWRLLRMGFRLDGNFATIEACPVQAACPGEDDECEGYHYGGMEDRTPVAMAAKAKFEAPTSPGLFLGYALASDKNDHRSTSGVYLCLQGPHTFVPVAAHCKKQTSCSKSTPEAEIVALHDGITKQGIPGLALWEMVKEKIEPVIVAEDNEAAVRVIISGKNPNMRYLSRTQRVDIARLNQFYEAAMFKFVNCPTEYQAANMMTKAINEAREWLRGVYTTGHFGEEEFGKATGGILAMPACRGVSQNSLDCDIRDTVGIATTVMANGKYGNLCGMSVSRQSWRSMRRARLNAKE